MELVDLPYLSSSEDQEPPKDANDVVSIEIERDIGAVLVGYDAGFNLRMVTKACSYLKNPDCIFIGSCEDSCLPINSPLLIPGVLLHKLSHKKKIPNVLRVYMGLFGMGVAPMSFLLYTYTLL